MAGNRSVAPVMGIIGAAAVCFFMAACYTLQPVAGSIMPVLGTRIAVDITDAGRAALGGQMGQEIGQIEGRLVRNDGASYELAVSTVRLLRGGEQVWNGERIVMRPEYGSRLYEKQFSKGRTVAISAVGVGVIAYFATKAILGSVLGDDGQLPSDSADAIRRPVRP